MRDTIDFGIDLGTTNSALAVATGGAVEAVKNNARWDYTPAAGWRPRPRTIHRGRRVRLRFPEREQRGVLDGVRPRRRHLRRGRGEHARGRTARARPRR